MASLSLDDRQIAQAGACLIHLMQALEYGAAGGRVMPRLDRRVLSALRTEPFPTEGMGIDRLFADITERVVPNSTNTRHPRFLAYVLGTPNGLAPFADAIAAALNQNCNVWPLSPAANAIEQNVVSWFAQLFNYPATAGGLITSGGSMAMLTAIAAALHAHVPDLRHTGLQSRSSRLVLYTSDEAHRSVDKTAAILGLGTEHVRRIATDDAFRMRVDCLSDAIAKDRRAGRQPFCVVATAGTVTTGAIDPIADVAGVCQRHGLWLHVDAAFGGFFVLSRHRREALLACEQADSIGLDPHKLLFMPLEAGGLVVRDRTTLERAFHLASPYLPDQEDSILTNYAHQGVELSRSFKAFKIWCSLRAFGVESFVAAIDSTLDMARYLERQLLKTGIFDVVAPVTLNAVCFKVRAASDAAQQQVLAAIIEEGTAFLGPATIRGHSAIRACVANYRTRTSDLDQLVERLAAHAATSHGWRRT